MKIKATLLLLGILIASAQHSYAANAEVETGHGTRRPSLCTRLVVAGASLFAMASGSYTGFEQEKTKAQIQNPDQIAVPGPSNQQGLLNLYAHLSDPKREGVKTVLLGETKAQIQNSDHDEMYKSPSLWNDRAVKALHKRLSDSEVDAVEKVRLGETEDPEGHR